MKQLNDMVFFLRGFEMSKNTEKHINAQNEHNRIDTMARKRDCQRYEYIYIVLLMTSRSFLVSSFKIEIK